MNLEIVRKEFTDKSTIGDLLIDGKFFSYTLEDAVRDVKIPGKTAIPEGTYEVVVNKSNRFKRQMPLLLNVPGYEGVRIHNGNTAEQTEGCPLIGYSKGVNFIGKSKNAFGDFFPILQAACKKEKVFITVRNGQPEVAANV
ncbi:MAG: DUF5675 family protein [Deltaproteobacteria bacterium]|nr:DUF5675 family protein [Deltaproteobacteria bacterium]